ncbi:MAG: DUF6775 family putative metallopeptidase [Nitrosopumilaceae archaeon]
MSVSKIFLYDEPSVPEINISNLADFLKNTFKINVEIRENILRNSDYSTAQKIASCRIFNTRKPFEKHNPTENEIIFEKENFEDTSRTENIIMYDGFEFQKILTELIPAEEISDNFHVIFTNKLTCSYDYNDYRYHGRTVICSNPSIISTTGIIEAPAKPREYYMELMTNMRQGLNVETVKKKYSGRYLEYHDARLSKIIQGILLQAVFYYFFGEVFCDLRECRLFNAHWQSDLMHSQLESGKLCKKHQEILDGFVKNLNL